LAAISAIIGLWFFYTLPWKKGFGDDPKMSLWSPVIYASFLYGIYAGFRKSMAVLAQSISADEVAKIANRGGFTLYLRSFLDDAFQFDLGSSGWRRFLFLWPTGKVYQAFARSVRLEELVVKALWCFRPVICVACPNGAPEPIGALQLPLQPGDWQKDVNQLAERAVSVLMVLGATPGVQWELRELQAQTNLRGKLILLIPPEGPALITSLWQACFAGTTSFPASSLLRTLAVKTLPDGSMFAITADERSRYAYKVCLHLAESLASFGTMRQEQELLLALSDAT
jgi:hypothetical protein